jgi:predicted AAA+ superfamily ATPase
MKNYWRGIHYWRSKHWNEIDFVLASRGQPLTAIECKWSAGVHPAGP